MENKQQKLAVKCPPKEGEIDLNKLKRGGFVKIRGKDMFSVWVKNLCCNMPALQLRKVADIAEKYGKGYVLFSSRQIPIIPYIRLKDVENVKKELDKVYLELAGCGSRVRNIDICYDEKYCSEAVTNSQSLGLKLDKFFYYDLKHKTKISVSGCIKGCTVPRVLSDIGFVGIDKGRYNVYLGGRLGTHPMVGIKMAENLSEEDCVKFVENYFKLLVEHAKGKEWRSADLISNLGVEKVKKELLKFKNYKTNKKNED